MVVKDRCPNLDIALLSCSCQRYDYTAEYIIVNYYLIAKLSVRCRSLEHSAEELANTVGPLMSLPPLLAVRRLTAPLENALHPYSPRVDDDSEHLVGHTVLTTASLFPRNL